MRVIAKNEFHNSECVLVISDETRTFSKGQMRKIGRLCGSTECQCWGPEFFDASDGEQLEAEDTTGLCDEHHWGGVGRLQEYPTYKISNTGRF